LINIALQFVFKMSAFGFNTSLKACTPLANGSIDDQIINSVAMQAEFIDDQIINSVAMQAEFISLHCQLNTDRLS